VERAATNQLISQWLESVSAILARIPQTRVKLAIYIILIIWITHGLVTLVWVIVPQPEMSATLPVTANSQAKSQAGKSLSEKMADIKLLQGWNLFGEANPSAQEETVTQDLVATELSGIENEATATRLQLVLQGVVTASNPVNSRAMIEYQKKQDLYQIGDALPVGKRVTLAKVLSDRVILDNAGRYESLLLYDEGKVLQPRSSARSTISQRPAAGPGSEKVMDRRGDETITKMASEYRRQLISNPTSLADVINVSVAKDPDGSVIGYKVRPGRHREQFTQFGLKNGDVVTQINGIELNNPTRALEVYRLLREAQEATFSVRRGQEEISIIVGLDDA
jgi:general secretion pathway protein C